MEERKHRFTLLFEAILLIGLMAGLAFSIQHFLINQETGSGQVIPYPAPEDQDESSSTYPGIEDQLPEPTRNSPISQPYPSPEETVEYFRPPQCQFGESDVTISNDTQSIEPEFSDPEIVRRSPNDIILVGWLPDSQRVLLTHDNHRDVQRQSIELFNPNTGEIQVFAERRISQLLPVWLESLKAVVYPEMIVLDDTKQPMDFIYNILISKGGSENTLTIAEDISISNLAVNSTKDQFAFMADNQFITQSDQAQTTRVVDFDISKWEYPKEYSWHYFPYNTAWRPDSSQVAMYNDGYFFMVDTETAQVCEINIEGWAGVARWSPDGRYLAIVRTFGPIPVDQSELVVLDTATGKQYTLGSPEMDGKPDVTNISDIAWAPNSINLIIIGEVQISGERDNRGLFFVDFINDHSIPILPEYSFGGGWWGTNLIWSPDGTQLIAACPTGEEERLCLIDVRYP